MSKTFTFPQVKDFFMSWGLYPESNLFEAEEEGHDLESLASGINRCCYQKLLAEALKIGDDLFQKFCQHAISNAPNDSYSLRDSCWKLVKERWIDYLEDL